MSTDDDRDPDLWEALQRLDVEQQRYERSLAGALGVDRTSLEVLYQLIVVGPGTPSDLARRTGLSTAVVTQVVHRLEDGSHVHRSPHASDGRKVVVTVDDATSARAWQHVAPLVHALGTVIDPLDGRDRRVVGSFLAAVTRLFRDTDPREGVRGTHGADGSPPPARRPG